MKARRLAFLLLEMIVATLVLAILGSALGRIFTNEMQRMSLASEYSEVSRLAAQKMFDLELQWKQFSSLEQSGELKNQTGTFPENPKYQYRVRLSPHEKFPELQVLTLTVSGLKQSREVTFTEWLRQNPDTSGKTEPSTPKP